MFGQFLPPPAKPKSTVRELAVRSRVRPTMPLGAYWVSARNERIFSLAESMSGCSFMRLTLTAKGN